MSNAKRTGTCHICGAHGELSFEHVPPRSAYNDRLVRVARGDQLIQGIPIENLRTQKQPRGAGDYTLCIPCNNTTGGLYGRAYADWTRQAMVLLDRASGAPTLMYEYRIYPLRVIKQVVTMFFSVNSPDFRKEVPYLVQFVLNRHLKGLPPEIRIYGAYTTSTHTRSAGKSGILYEVGGYGHAAVVSEIGARPFIYVMTLGSDIPDRRPEDMSSFATCGYSELRLVWMSLPVLPVSTAYPTDYRTRDEVEKAAQWAKQNLPSSSSAGSGP